LLGWLLERLRGAELIQGVLVATTTAAQDDAIAELCDRLGTDCFRGHPTDVLQRYVGAASVADAESLVRVSADSPLLDGATVDRVVAAFAHCGEDIVQNHRPADWPHGTAVEVLSTRTLRRLDHLATSERHREHVTLYAYDHPEEITTRHVPPPPELVDVSFDVCVDTAQDLERVRGLCDRFRCRVTVPLVEMLTSPVPDVRAI
jgi:spore coat polysaccharide biosynthesis protein SpsF